MLRVPASGRPDNRVQLTSFGDSFDLYRRPILSKAVRQLLEILEDGRWAPRRIAHLERQLVK